MKKTDAAAVAVAGAAVWRVAERSPSSVHELTAFAEDHVRALQGDAISTADPVGIEGWLRGRVPSAAKPGR